MSDLIKITTKDGKQLVSARELYEFLGATERFSKWFERYCKYGFLENTDYVGCKVFNTLANQELQDYAMTIDMAKEFSMLQRTEKGKQARLYFIECEKKLKEVDAKANLLLSIYNGGQEGIAAAKKLTELEVEEATKPLLPKAEFYDEIIDSSTVVSMKKVADILNIKGYGRNNLFKFLRDKGILNRKNEPYRKYIADDEVKITTTTYVTQKGLDYIRKLFTKIKTML